MLLLFFFSLSEVTQCKQKLLGILLVRRFLMECNKQWCIYTVTTFILATTTIAISTGFDGDNLHSPFFVCYIPTVWHILYTLVPQLTHVNLHTEQMNTHKQHQQTIRQNTYYGFGFFFCSTITALIKCFFCFFSFMIIWFFHPASVRSSRKPGRLLRTGMTFMKWLKLHHKTCDTR